MPRPILATINTGAMAHNLKQVRLRLEAARHLQPGAQHTSLKLLAVIKANAYGHGILNALRGFAAADALGMIDTADLISCRHAGWQKDLLLLEGFFDAEDILILQHYQASTAVHCVEQIQMLRAAPPGNPINVFLKINTGMNRLGFLPQEALQRYFELAELQRRGIVGQIGLMMHFANADASDALVMPAYQAIQGVRQDSTLDLSAAPLSIVNSAACLRFPEFAFAAAENWVRPGICLYGSLPFDTQRPDLPPLSFLPTMTLQAKIIGIQHLQVGDSVGYSSLFTATKPTRIGVVACGYADGYPRVGERAIPVMVDGVFTQVVGRVSMDMITVDLSSVPNAGFGSNVVLWGEHGPSIDQVAHAAGRIGYELMCGLTKRVPVKVI